MKTETITDPIRKLDVQIEGVLNDFKTGLIQQPEAQSMLLSIFVDSTLRRLSNMCKEFKKMRDKQNAYFLTRDSKILRESKQLERALDEKIATMLKLEQERLNPKLPYNREYSIHIRESSVTTGAQFVFRHWLTAVADEVARAILEATTSPNPDTLFSTDVKFCACGCGRRLTGNKKSASDACRKRLQKKVQRFRESLIVG